MLTYCVIFISHLIHFGILVELRGISNVDNADDLISAVVNFELLPGSTEETNNKNTFRMKETTPDGVGIMLSQHLDYESITHYTLIVRVQNRYSLAAETQIDIEILDVNDNVPVFREVKRGSVLENEPIGVPVMQVWAIDADGTSAHNQVTYELENNKDYFAIDPQTGHITTLVTFDRERQDMYYLKVIATDNSPSALFNTGEHNKGEHKFQIEIADKNDNPPYFDRKVYTHNYIYENANINAHVTEVKAIDSDTASAVTYSITSGNTDDSFYIEGTTGEIRVNKQLDYERITKYNLTVRASDGVFNDTAQVEIFIGNVNDNPPVFLEFNKNPIIEEEKLVNECITVVKAYDPDIEDRNDDQHIVYSIVKEDQQPLIKIDKSGCIRLKKPLGRDPPNGYSTLNVNVMARDEDGSSTSLRNVVTVNITLGDHHNIMAKAVSFGIDINFIVAILVCVLILLILLVAVVVPRRKTDDLSKDMDDIPENIINYEDEGGGEVDTRFDLNVLRAIYDASLIDSEIAPDSLQGRGTEVSDICGFLDGKKESCENDPDTNPFDDLRHYAYEGECNSEGDLSSLASCTDDEDLNFNYLSNFGPKFKELADMYGEDPSDEESDGVGERESES